MSNSLEEIVLGGSWQPYASAGVLLAALLIDLGMGEVPTVVHPVVYIGRLIAWAERRMPAAGPAKQLLAGGVLAAMLPSGLFACAYFGLRELTPWPWLKAAVEGLLLTTCFAMKELWLAARRVRDSLYKKDLAQARFDLRSLCSRDATGLSHSELATATVESLAENASDSITAPLFYFALFGLPGALLYRAVNTLDAMLGYRDHRLYTGKCSARLDDILNIVPARLTAALFLLAGAILGHNSIAGLRTWLRDGGKTDSPNAGRPMATMAGLLGVCLDKPGQYRLGDAQRIANEATIDACWRIVWLATAIGFSLLLASQIP